MEAPKEQLLWGGRFDASPSSILQALNASISIDKEMWQQDLKGSIMYSRALLKAKLLTEEQQKSIENGLKTIETEWSNGKFQIKESDEDIHTANERRLKELIGPVGGMLHTGRSRNDQVAVDFRMWVKDDLKAIEKIIKDLIKVLVDRAEEDTSILMPGYTHLQRAQAIRWSHWLLSYAWILFNDAYKLKFIFWSTDVCPLGSGALAGTPFDIDREDLGKSLDFGRVTNNSLMAVADRDFVAEYLFWCSLTSAHLSRLAEDLILYSSSEFGFVRLSDEFSTGSSLMPQKKNPDSLELIRGKAGRLIGNVTAFLSTLKGLPSTYNKDLQDDKELLFLSAGTLKLVMKVATGTLESLKVDKEACLNALTENMLATDVAYFLVRQGVPFRDAHGMAGEVVKKAEDLGVSMSKIPLDELQKISPKFTADVSKIWNFENSVEQYSAKGGTGKASVLEQIKSLKAKLQELDVTKM